MTEALTPPMALPAGPGPTASARNELASEALLPSAPAPTSLAIGSRIKALRAVAGLTQDQLALACDVSRSAVAQWETGRAGQLRDNLARIADALGTSVEHILQGSRPQPETGDEIAMLRLYRVCQPEDRAFLLRTARRLAKQATPTP